MSAKKIVITDPDELAKGPRVGDIVTERVDTVGPATDGGSWDGTIVRIEREAPVNTSLTVPFDPKMLREAFCVAEHAVRQHVTEENQHGAPEVLAALIRECDRHRPLGPDGKHGQRHTPTCGCDDVPDRYQPAPAPEPGPGTQGEALVEGSRRPGFLFFDAGLRFAYHEEPFGICSTGKYEDFVPDDAEALRAQIEKLRCTVLDADDRLGEAREDVKNLRAARTLPTRLTVTKAVTREEFANALAQHYGDHTSLAAVGEPSTRQNYLDDADALLALLGGAE